MTFGALFHGATHFFDCAPKLALAEKGRAGHERIGARPRAVGGSGVIDATVHLDAKTEAGLLAPCGGLLDFWQRFGNKTLAAETRINGHDQQDIDLRQERLNAIREHVMALPERQRMAVLMHKYQGLDYRQIGEVLKLSESATKSLLFRAYQTLREKLKDFV